MPFLSILASSAAKIGKAIYHACVICKKHDGNAPPFQTASLTLCSLCKTLIDLFRKPVARNSFAASTLVLNVKKKGGITPLRGCGRGLLYGVLKRIPLFQRSTLLHLLIPYIGGFNLVPYRTRRAIQRRYKHSVGIAIASSLGAVMAVVLHYGALHTMYLRTLQRAKLEQTLAHLRSQVALSANLQHAVKAQAERTDLALALTEQMHSFSEILQAIAEIEPLGVHLQRMQFTPTTTTIVGTARTQRTLRDWLRRLQRNRTLPKVSITQVQRIPSTTMPASPLESGDVLAHAPIRPPLPANPFQNPFLDIQVRPSQTRASTHPPTGNSNAGLAFTVQLETALKGSSKQGEAPHPYSIKGIDPLFH